MTQYRKPIPKSQKEISNDLVNPYVNPENGESLGNPNIPSNFNQFTEGEQNGVSVSRSQQMSFKGDTTKPFTLGIQDIDESIMFYFQNVIKPTVIQNGVRISVPIIYGAPEKWKSAQKDGYYKDKNGAIMAPIIMFKRDSLEKDRSAGNKLDANLPHLYTSWKKVYNGKNSYSNFDILNNRIPTEQFIVNVIPDYVKLTYSCTIQTYYVEQLNKIVEAINYASDSYWGDPERFKFKATIDSFTSITELSSNSDRIVKSTFTISLFGYIVPDNIQKELIAVKKYNSKSQVIIGLEVTGNKSEFFTATKKKSPVIFPGPTGGGGGTGGGGTIDPATLTYLNTNIQKLGTFVSTTTITFASGWLPAPAGVPATSVNNFSIFVNGQLIELAAIVSFTESGGITTLVINETALGFGFDSQDEVIAIGKFNS